VVPVQIGVMRVTLPLEQLRPLKQAEAREAERRAERKTAPSTGASEIAMRKALHIAPELMLRAMRVEEAQPLLDKYVDDAYAAGIPKARIIHGVARLEVTPREPFSSMPLTLIPSYPDLPMEKVYPRTTKTGVAQVFLRELGPGRVAFFPWDIDRTFWEVLCVDHFKLLRNAVAWATNEPPVIEVSGPGMLDVTVWQQRHSFTVHLVNLTNPMMMKGPVREFIRIGEQQVRVRLPAGVKPRRVHLLAANKTVRAKRDGEFLTATVPSVLDHEVLAIDV